MNRSLLAVMLDWAGTLVDYGCFAPTSVFIRMFAEQHVSITTDEARGPMGRAKRDHIAAVMFSPAVQQRWLHAHGRMPDEADLDTMYDAFVPHQLQAIAQHSALIPGALDAVVAFRRRGLKIGTCSGYTRTMMEPLLAGAADQGFVPDAVIASDEVRSGRPAPWMCYRLAEMLDVYPLWRCVKIGDTPVDIEEGRNAGMWTVAVAKTGNQLGMSLDEIEVTPAGIVEARLLEARKSLSRADYVVDSIGDVPMLLDEIDARIRSGERPPV
jgi:phosphonoacetaldehyde hydrolase